MQCVLICAGKGTRMRPLTDATPKPLLPVCGNPILDHIVEALPPEIDELIIVVGYLEEQIREHCGAEFHGRRVQYVTQDNFAGGTGDALMCARPLLSGTFLMLNGDDIHGAKVLAEVVEEPHAIIGVYSETPELFGVLVQNEDGTLKEIIEKPKNPPSHFVNTGGFVASLEIFDKTVQVSNSGELYATDMLTAYATDHPVKIIEQNSWIPIGNPEQIKVAEAILCPEYIDNVI